jgi:prepilin-type N-terminal cleavage/methylation domain-containing protein
MPNTHGHVARAGFSLVEVMVALLLVVVALVALEAGAAVTVRTLADAGRETTAMRFAEGERERAYGAPCAAARGVDSANGVRVAWSATPVSVGGTAVLAMRASGAFRTRYGLHASAFDGAGPCR